MSPVFDFLHAVDWIVDDPVAVAERLSAVFGLPEVRADFEQTLPTHGYQAVFSRVSSRMVDAPTRLELIDARPVVAQEGCSVAPLAEVAGLQARRPQRTHATVVCVADVEGFVESARSRGAPVWVEPGCEHLPHPRAWVGWTDGGTYVPGFDGGLWFEVIATSALGPRMVESVAFAGRNPAAARVGRRVHLVGDLDATVRTLEASTGFAPDGPLRRDDRLGGRVATYRFAHAASADLELVQPRGDGPAADYFATWGEGPLLTTFAVPDAEATAAGAVEAGATPAEGWETGHTTVFRDDALGGILVEIATNGEELR